MTWIDALAWAVVVAAYFFVVCPCIFSGPYSDYLESVAVGVAFHFVIGLFVAVFGSIFWAVSHVIG